MSSPTHTFHTLKEALQQMALPPGAPLLVHSSLRSLGWVEGGAPTVVDAILAALSPDSTVLFPTLTGRSCDHPEHRPCCDQRQQTTWCGAIPRAALRHPQHLRSIHPTHSVAAIGPQAAHFIAAHSSACTPCGIDSPYLQLARSGGYILLLGVGHDANTTFHSAEELVEAPYVSYPGRYPCTVIDTAGKHHAVVTPIHRWDRPRCFETLRAALNAAGIVRELQIAQAPCRLMGAQHLIDWLVELLRREPSALLARNTPCP